MKTLWHYLFFIILSSSLAGEIFAQPLVEKLQHPRHKNHGIFATPLFSYAPETRLALGASMIAYFRMDRHDSTGRPCVLHPFMGYTQNHQFFNENQFLLFLKKEKYYSYGDISYFNFPYRFYGIGNNNPPGYQETYEGKFLRLRASMLMKVVPHSYAGFRIHFDHYRISKATAGGLLDPNVSSSIEGKTGGINSGIGPMILFDNRDNIFSPLKGSFIELASVLNSKFTGSRYKYQLFSVDIRKFQSFYIDHVLAFQAYFNFISGTPPFYQMALMGGPRRMRGYYEGRYRDKNLGLVQLEYRSPFFLWRFGFATFGALGVVYHSLNEINTNTIKPSYGGGIRFRLDRKEKLNLRFDVAMGYKSVGYYFILNEAF
ncbi:MAG: BamA/TamA family outer membrane protein [Cytophagaceae bacterium]